MSLSQHFHTQQTLNSTLLQTRRCTAGKMILLKCLKSGNKFHKANLILSLNQCEMYMTCVVAHQTDSNRLQETIVNSLLTCTQAVVLCSVLF